MFEKLHIEDLSQYEIVYEILAKKAASTNRKIVILNAYLRFLDFKEIPPKYVPRYTRIESLPFVPTENKIDSLISSLGGRKISTMFLIAKETGARLGEIWSFKWHDIDFEKATVSINSPEKNSDPRQLRVSQKLLNMLRKFPQRNEYIFRYNKESSRKSIEIVFYQLRKRVAIRLEDPELQRITFMSLRHFKASQEYRRTRDILHVRDILGHKSLKNTLIYTHLLEISKTREKKVWI